MIGKTVAHYEVTGLIGKGGMGEVYRARDTKLDREVALKVLPPDLARDAERVARFEREARTLATLQHPNVASVYGFEETPEARFLVLELVEGEDLAERLERGPVPVEDAVAIARQIAEGLEAAHERNIVHRDLKPANVKLAPDGTVKILDFGLARAYVGDLESGEDLAHSPTITAAMTQAGTILGTAAYMSPEQAKGKSVDKRADIWAFGAIIYEMLTGQRLFEAETISETIAGVLLTEIDLSALPEDTPASLRILLNRCLQKDPKSRLRDVGEARIILADPTASVALRVATTGEVVEQARGSRLLPIAAFAAIALLLGWFGGRALKTSAPPPELPPLLFDYPDPEKSMVTGSLALSPDGRHLVFARRDSTGVRSLWIRRLDEELAREIPATDGGRQPFWSADGQSIGYFINNDLFRTRRDGSASSQIGGFAKLPLGGTWNADGVILVGSNQGPISRVAAVGGQVTAVTEVDSTIEDTHAWPVFFPDGDHFLYLADAASDEGHRLYVQSLKTGERKILRTGVRSITYVDPAGALLTTHNGQLFAWPFDFDRREYVGERMLIEDGIQPFGQRHECAMTISANGILAFQQGSDESVIVRASLDGNARELILPEDRYRNPRVSPDGRKIVFEIQGSTSERLVWVQDLDRGTRTLISERGAMADSPAWSPDGQTIYFGSSISGEWQAYRKRLYGGAGPELLGIPDGALDLSLLEVSADGNSLLVAVSEGGNMNLFLADLTTQDVEWERWTDSPASEPFARFSPDGEWLAFVSDATGRHEIYVAPREGGPSVAQWAVSVQGGEDPCFSRDGSKLYYRTLAGVLMEVDVRTEGGTFEFDTPRQLFELHPPTVGYLRNGYDMLPSGDALVAFVETGGRTPAIRLRTGWRNW